MSVRTSTTSILGEYHTRIPDFILNRLKELTEMISIKSILILRTFNFLLECVEYTRKEKALMSFKVD